MGKHIGKNGPGSGGQVTRISRQYNPFENPFLEKSAGMSIFPVKKKEKYADKSEDHEYHQVDNNEHCQCIITLSKRDALPVFFFRVCHISPDRAVKLSDANQRKKQCRQKMVLNDQDRINHPLTRSIQNHHISDQFSLLLV